MVVEKSFELPRRNAGEAGQIVMAGRLLDMRLHMRKNLQHAVVFDAVTLAQAEPLRPVRGARFATDVLVFTTVLGRILGFAREEAVVLLFCGSKKSLASGVPMAGVLFAPAQVGSVLLPLIMFHQLQLIACALIAPRLAKRAEVASAAPGEPVSAITSAP